MLLDDGLGQFLQPAQEARVFAVLLELAQRHLLHQGGRLLPGLDGQEVIDRVGRRVLISIPLRGALMQARQLFGIARLKLAEQHLGEEIVIAIPALLFEPRDEQVLLPQVREHGVAVVLPGQGIAQAPVEMLEDRGLQQEFLYARARALQYRLHEVLAHVDVRAAEGVDEVPAIFLLGQRHGGESQACRPALCVFDEGLQVGVGEGRILGVLLQIVNPLSQREAQVLRFELGQATL